MKKIFILLVFGLILLPTLINAQEETGGQYSKQGALYMDNGIIINTLAYVTVEVNKSINLYMTPYEQSGKTLDNESVECRVGITNHDGNRLLLLEQENFTFIGDNDIWIAEIPASFLNETGNYLLSWDCQKPINGGYFNTHLEVTKDGEHIYDNGVFLTQVFLLTFFIMLIIMFYIIDKSVNYDKWYRKIKSKYENKNYVKFVLGAITYNIMKNIFIIYYLIGLLIMTVLTGLVYNYNITSMIGVMDSLMVIYTVGIIVVGIVFLSKIQEWFMDLLDEVKNFNWGHD